MKFKFLNLLSLGKFLESKNFKRLESSTYRRQRLFINYEHNILIVAISVNGLKKVSIIQLTENFLKNHSSDYEKFQFSLLVWQSAMEIKNKQASRIEISLDK